MSTIEKSLALEQNKDESYKKCPCCGQNKIPFKLGVCMCGMQVGHTQYVRNSKKYAENWYSFAECDASKVEKLGIVELVDN